MLTLIGPGGIGKTRLALEVARNVLNMTLPTADLFNDGCYFVPLQPVNTISNIAAAVADALDLRLYENRASQEQLFDHLADKRMLLVLDNFEHLLNGIDLLTEIQKAAPAVTLLVTSREAVRLHEAWFHPVAGMFFPKSADENGKPQAEFDAVRLFALCASRTQKDFNLEKHLAHVVHICQLVDGMPLALELAAAWLKALPAKEVADEIRHSLDILMAQHQNVPERHRSVRAVFMQSWEQLQRDEQDVLMKLSVFRGGCDPEAAQRVTGASMPILLSLVDNALLRRTQGGRYELHELLRQFLVEKVADARLEIELHEAHSGYYLQMLDQQGSALIGANPRQAIARLKVEMDNFRQAWQWAMNCGHWETINSTMEPFFALHEFAGLHQEASNLFCDSIQQIEMDTENKFLDDSNLYKTLCHLYGYYAESIAYTQNLDQATEIADKALELAEKIGDKFGAARAHLVKSIAMDFAGKPEEMLECAEQAVALSQDSHQSRLNADALNSLSWACYRNQLPERALAYAQKATQIHTQAQNPFGQANGLCQIAAAYHLQERYDQALRYFQEALLIFEELDASLRVAYTASNIGVVYYHLERYQEALDYSYRALKIHVQHGNKSQEASVLENLGEIQVDVGDYPTAKQTLERSLELCQQTGAKLVECGVRYKLGRLHIALGNDKEAERQLEKAQTLAQEIPEPKFAAACTGERGTIYHRKGHFSRALEFYNQALPELQQYWQFARPQFLLQKAALLLKLEKFPQAQAVLDEGIEAARVMNRQTLVFKGLVLSAKILFAAGETIQATKQLKTLLETADDQAHRADLYYELWRINREDTYAQQAHELYTQLYTKTSNIDYYNRIEQLAAPLH
ncbi:tetratricopeptide repeat protein [Chloroflexi bacterium TSY]|nr:tetratricopeptide repeat protein [Chloroflexi bacterium TSY]